MKKPLRDILFVLLILNSVAAFIYVFFYPNQPTRKQSFKIANGRKVREKQNPEVTKFILYWIPMWDSATFSFGHEGFELFKYCEFKNCFATHNRKLIPIENFDAIIFHTAQYDEKKHGVPMMRNGRQRYIFANMESPIRPYPTNLYNFREFYNWTMTYRSDSDIVRPYGRIIKSPTNYNLPNVDFVKNKTNTAAWFVSNCHTINRREELYRNLLLYMKIDVYGSCGGFKCPKIEHESSENCYDLLEDKYKFYLSFENAHCKDYVTEKLFRLLQRNIVPVVYGHGDYKNYAPPNSVIVAEDFASAKQLADYLLYLDRNPEEYLKYFEWKRWYHVDRKENETVCRLCQMLQDPLEPHKIYDDIFGWWLGDNFGNCVLFDRLPNISVPVM